MVYFTDYLSILNKHEIFLQAHITISIYGPIYNMISPLIIIILPLILSSIIPKKYINTFINIFFVGVPSLKIFQIKTLRQLAYTIITGLMFFYNLYNSIKTSLKTQKIMVFIKKKLTNYNKFIDIITQLNDIIPMEETTIPAKKNINCSRGQLIINYLNLPEKKQLRSLLKYVGQIDVFLACSNLTNQNYCLAQSVSNNKCIIYLKDTYHPLLNNPIKNTIKLNGKNMIITGPNAGGKTTFMKTIVINVLLAQSLGISLSEKLIFTPFNKYPFVTPDATKITSFFIKSLMSYFLLKS